jgi:UDP-N-acetylglucosamine 4,6-dehydratase
MLTLRALDHLRDARILITGGTGSLGKQLTRLLLDGAPGSTVIIYSRDEFKQFEIEQRHSPEDRARLRFFLGDVRSVDRLRRAFDGVDYVIHAAALKQVPAAEYNPFEFVQTNIMGRRTSSRPPSTPGSRRWSR